VAVQLTVVVPAANDEFDAGVQTTATLPSTRSTAVATKVTTAAGVVVSIVMSAGSVSTGAVVSVTVTMKLPDPVLPLVSVAEQVTVVLPTGNDEPLAGAHSGVIAPSTRSDALAANVTTVPAPVASIVMSAGTLTTGAVVSTTVTVKLADPVLPAASVAAHVTVVAPREKLEPEAGLQLGVSGPPGTSLAVAVKVTTSPPGPVASTVMSSGTSTTGGIESYVNGVVAQSVVSQFGDCALTTIPALSGSKHDPPGSAGLQKTRNVTTASPRGGRLKLVLAAPPVLVTFETSWVVTC
jgi:hypothetical protein